MNSGPRPVLDPTHAMYPSLMLASRLGRPTASAVPSADIPGWRTYVCDQESHVIHVLDQHRRPIFSFGGFGAGPGQFDTPTQVAVVWVETADPSAFDSAIVIVADRGNDRIQLFEPDGAPIGTIGNHGGPAVSDRVPAGTGWPFFRLDDRPFSLDDGPPLPLASHLEWRAPYLDVTCAGGVVRVNLAAALLPGFDTWIAEAPPAELRQAFHRFIEAPAAAAIPDSCVYEIAERLQPEPRGGRLLS